MKILHRVARLLASDDPQPASDVGADSVGSVQFAHDLDRWYFGNLPSIEVDVGQDVLQALFDRTKAQWTTLGETEPYWSVLTNEDFKRRNFDDAVAERFYETGERSASMLEHFSSRAGFVDLGSICLELGCGVGRITEYLASRFDRVVAVDVSAGNLALCRERMKIRGRANVEFVLMNDVRDVEQLPRFDTLYSVIALQHNSPPVQAYLLDQLMKLMRSGGACLFQTLTCRPDYRFVAADYLASTAPEMEMHALPQVAVFRLMRAHGLQIQEVAVDGWTGTFGSYTFFATKPA